MRKIAIVGATGNYSGKMTCFDLFFRNFNISIHTKLFRSSAHVDLYPYLYVVFIVRNSAEILLGVLIKCIYLVF